MLRKFFIFILLILTSCAVNPVTGQRELMLVSEAQEISIGKEAAPSLNWEFGGGYNDPALESYLGGIAKRIWLNAERPWLPMEFHVQNTSIPNAFALPGYIAITRGLLSELENEAQFAAIIGHEIGHVMARHSAQRMSRAALQQIGLAAGAGALAGKKGADTLLTIGAIGTSLYLLKYDRSQEIQADRLGARYMAELGYDPEEALRAHKVLEISVDSYLKRQGKSRSGEDFISSLLSTHPRTEVRLDEIRQMINELPAYNITGDGKFSMRFQNVIQSIKNINRVYFIYDEAENNYKKRNFTVAEQKINQAISINNRQAPFYNLLGFVKLRQKNYTGAYRSFSKALSIDPGYQPAIYGLGVVHYSQGSYEPAIHEFKRSLALYPEHPGSLLAAGKSYYFIRRYREAIPYLRNFAAITPEHPEVHGLLGICYENTGDLRSAVREYRNQVKVAPDTELGIHAKKRLEVLAPN
ncbi:TPR repeat-containing protein YfgC precursor [bacterium BMS3Abin10]|nr:TPR repeat-containing protein YfgC precursor [bacterium BMS3Abin10]